MNRDGSLTDIGEFSINMQMEGERLLKNIDGDVVLCARSAPVPSSRVSSLLGGSSAGIAGSDALAIMLDSRAKEITG
jgi:hypothetical protein